MAEELFYIQDTRSYCGNSCYWWRVDGHGYTTNLAEAWRVPREQAERVIRSRPDVDKAWPCSLIDAGATTETYFDAQKLRNLQQLKPRLEKVMN